MRITLVSPFDPFPAPAADGGAHVGGVERVFAELSQKLVARGHQVTVLCSTDGTPGAWLDEGLTVLRVRRAGTILRTPVVNLARHLPKDSDLVHVAATYPFTTPTVLRRARALRIPAVLDFHFEPAPGDSIGRMAADAYRRIGPPAYRTARAVIVRSYAYGRSAPSLAEVPESRWRIVPNGIDPAHFNADGPSRDGDYLLFVGRLVPYKGLSVLFQALRRAKVDVPLLIAGDGPLRKELEALARRLRLDVQFLGRVAEEDLPALYRGARYTLLPSVTSQEAFGISLIESMACGTPVVASALPGVKDVAEFGGLVAHPGDPVSLATQIRRALATSDIERGRDLAARVHAHYSWDAVTDRLLKVYEEVLGKDVGAKATATDARVTVAPVGAAVAR